MVLNFATSASTKLAESSALLLPDASIIIIQKYERSDFLFSVRHDPGEPCKKITFRSRYSVDWFRKKNSDLVEILNKLGIADDEVTRDALLASADAQARKIANEIWNATDAKNPEVSFGDVMSGLIHKSKERLLVSVTGFVESLLWDLFPILINGKRQRLGDLISLFYTEDETIYENEAVIELCAGKTRVCFASNATIPNCKNEKNYLLTQCCSRVELVELPGIDKDDDGSSKAKFLEILSSDESEIVHFCTHGHHNADEYSVVVDDDAHILGAELNFYKRRRVFLFNLCKGSNPCPFVATSLAKHTLIRYPSVAVATVCSVNDGLALEFIKSFYQSFLQEHRSVTVADAVHEAREIARLQPAGLQAYAYKIFGWPNYYLSGESRNPFGRQQ